MRKLSVDVSCLAYYISEIDVPDGLSLKEAIQYAREHMGDIEMTELNFIEDSDICDENCCWLDGKED